MRARVHFAGFEKQSDVSAAHTLMVEVEHRMELRHVRFDVNQTLSCDIYIFDTNNDR